MPLTNSLRDATPSPKFRRAVVAGGLFGLVEEVLFSWLWKMEERKRERGVGCVGDKRRRVVVVAMDGGIKV